jgi:hypothetical protein
VDSIVTPDRSDRWGGLKNCNLTFETMRVHEIIIIENRDITTLSRLKPSLERGTTTTVVLSDHSESRVVIAVKYLRRLIRRSVVDDEKFEILERLIERALDCSR